MDNEIVFIQTCPVSEIHTDFLRCCQVECGDAEGIRGAIEKATTYLDTWERFCNKLVALGLDGASVMTGKTWCYSTPAKEKVKYNWYTLLWPQIGTCIQRCNSQKPFGRENSNITLWLILLL